MKQKIKKLVKGARHYFFGYYDLPQVSKDGKYALVLGVDFIDRFPSGKEKADILLIDLKTGKQEKISETRAWNWQQGCMLQWFPPDHNSKIIFNDLRGGKFVAVIVDIKNKREERVIGGPVYEVHPSGKYFLSLNFSRLDNLRKGYGYPGLRDKNYDKKVPIDEGIYLIDLNKNKSKRIISLKDLKDYNPIDSMCKGKHWVNHLKFNPRGDRFCFFHRWNIEGGLSHTRFFTCNLNGKKLHCFRDSGFYSHFAWKNNKELFGWCSASEKFGKIRQGGKRSNFLIEKVLPIYRKIIPKFIRKRALPVGYYILKDKTKEVKRLNIHNEDGHPSFSENEKYIVTDTYPNKKHQRKLIIYDLKRKKKKIVGNFFSLPDKKYVKGKNAWKKWENSGLRCDLHPRFDFQNKLICFDSIHEGKRNCYLWEL